MDRAQKHFQIIDGGNFWYDEFFVSEKFPGETQRLLDYTPIPRAEPMLYLLCVFIMQPTRDHIAFAMTVLSGVRDQQLVNKIYYDIGKEPIQHSLHKEFICADFTCYNKDGSVNHEKLRQAFEFIRDNLKYGELIYYKKRGFIHVSLPKKGYNKTKEK